MTTYQINGLLKFTEQDDYENGCDPDTATSFEVDVKFTGKSAMEVIEKAAAFLGVETKGENNGVELNACDEKGRVDFAKMEDADSTTPNKTQIAAWKKGREKLYYAVYSARVEKVTTAKL